METVIEEADETLFWLEIIEETNIISEKNQIQILKKEANELISMFVSSVITVKKRLNKKH
jgi:four helix bundle protein